MQYSSALFEFEGASSMVAKVIRRVRGRGPLYLTKLEQRVLLKHLEGYLLIGDDKKILARVLAKLKANPN